MTENTYQKTKTLLSDVKNKIDSLQYSYVDKTTTNPNIKSVQLAQATSTTSTDSSELDFDNIDLGSYVNGVFVKVQDNQVVNVVKSSEYAKKLEEIDYTNKAVVEKFLSELASKYPEGVTEEQYEDASKKVKRVIVNQDGIANEYREVTHNWGGVYYFRNGQSISKTIFYTDTNK